jgi:hypothetical protein
MVDFKIIIFYYDLLSAQGLLDTFKNNKIGLRRRGKIKICLRLTSKERNKAILSSPSYMGLYFEFLNFFSCD